MHIVPVEDQTSRRRGIAWRLKDEGQSVDALASGDEAEAFLRQSGCDVVILDINLQGGSGIEVLHRLRARGDPRLVLLLTARDEVADRVAGLDAGATTISSNPSPWTNSWPASAPSPGGGGGTATVACGRRAVARA